MAGGKCLLKAEPRKDQELQDIGEPNTQGKPRTVEAATLPVEVRYGEQRT